MTPCCETHEGIPAKIWSIKDVFLQVIRVGDFIICFLAEHCANTDDSF